MRFSAVLRCVTSGTTLTKKISHLAERVEQHLSTPHDGLAPDARAQAVDDLWQQVVATVPSARALKETDTLLALVCRMLRYGVKPAHDKAASTTWSVLIGDLAPYSDIEANSVLAYPGTVESFLGGEGAMGNALCGNTNGNRDSGEWEGPPLLQLTRETLLLTGGVVPLSSRVPCTDGRVLGQLLGAFCGCCESVAESSVCGDALTKSCLLEVSAAVLNALKVFEDAITGENCKFLNPPLLRLLRLLVRLDHERGSQQNKQGSVSLEFTEDFCERLTNVLPTNALGARIVLHFIFEQHNLFPEEMVPLALVCVAFRGVWLRYAKADDSFPCLKHLQSMNEAVDVTLQRNANNNNLLGLREGDEAELRLLLSVALLRGMRLHADSPEEFLRNAISIVDSCPASISVEYEILMAKTKLLEMFSDDETSCSAIYDDLLQSLRAIVELRPRDVENDTPQADLHRGENVPCNDQISKQQHQQMKRAEEDKQLLQEQFQEVHKVVVEVFVRSHIQERLNQAYTILVTHKYHGLVITQEVAYPLLDVLSHRGDCRVFNIVDLCVLYSGSSIDYDALTCLFRACRVAGDFYRARTLYQLLKEMIPGFLLRAPPAIREMLRELKILDPEPAHMFTETLAVEEALSNAVSVDEVLSVGLLDDEAVPTLQRGPLRELPAVKGE